MEYEPKVIPEGINTSTEHPLRELFVLIIGLGLVIVIVTGFLVVSTDFLIQYIPLEKENGWIAKDILNDGKQPNPDASTAAEVEAEQYLQQLVEQLRYKDKPDYKFTVQLLSSDLPNAFVLPGGHIFVTAGLLDVVESENGLAMVLAHEMGHQYHRHPLRSLGRGIVISLALMVISGTESDTLVQSFVGNAAVLTSLSFNREQEREADKMAVDLLIKHYGHASGSGEFFEAMKEQLAVESEAPEFLSTHPGIDERLELLRTHGRQSSGDVTPLPGVFGRYLEAIESS